MSTNIPMKNTAHNNKRRQPAHITDEVKRFQEKHLRDFKRRFNKAKEQYSCIVFDDKAKHSLKTYGCNLLQECVNGFETDLANNNINDANIKYDYERLLRREIHAEIDSLFQCCCATLCHQIMSFFGRSCCCLPKNMD